MLAFLLTIRLFAELLSTILAPNDAAFLNYSSMDGANLRDIRHPISHISRLLYIYIYIKTHPLCFHPRMQSCVRKT